MSTPYSVILNIRTCIAGRSWGRSAGRPSPCFSVPLGGKLPVWPSHGLPKWSVTVPAVIRPDGKKENSRAAKELLPDFFPLLLSSPQALCPSFSISPSHILFGEMASSLRIGTSALRSSIAKPVQSAALNGARCYSSAKAKV